MKSFNTFLGHKDRENKSHLHLIEEILKKAGFSTENNLDDNEPHIYVKKPTKVNRILEDLSFEGIRLYTRGNDIICYRAQNEDGKEPFGGAYQLDVKGMFKDLVKESSKETVGYKIIFNIIRELKEFFIKSAEADKTKDDDAGKMGTIVSASGPNDFSNQIFNK